MHFVYLLEHPNYEKIYIGCTNNLERRLNEHRSKAGNNFTTRVSNPEKWQVIYVEIFRSQEAAYIREKNLKKYGSALQRLKKRI